MFPARLKTPLHRANRHERSPTSSARPSRPGAIVRELRDSRGSRAIFSPTGRGYRTEPGFSHGVKVAPPLSERGIAEAERVADSGLDSRARAAQVAEGTRHFPQRAPQITRCASIYGRAAAERETGRTSVRTSVRLSVRPAAITIPRTRCNNHARRGACNISKPP